jgi:hypothetical protein
VRGRFSRSPRPAAIEYTRKAEDFGFGGLSPPNPKWFPLCDLGVSAVKANNFLLCLIRDSFAAPRLSGFLMMTMFFTERNLIIEQDFCKPILN